MLYATMYSILSKCLRISFKMNFHALYAVWCHFTFLWQAFCKFLKPARCFTLQMDFNICGSLNHPKQSWPLRLYCIVLKISNTYNLNGKKLHQCNTVIKFKNEQTCHSMTISTEKGPSWETTILSASPDISRTLAYLRVHYQVHKSLPLVLVLS